MLPVQKPHLPIWFPGGSSPESIQWAATHQYTYINLGAILGLTLELKQMYIDVAREVGFTPGPEHFGYSARAFVADTDEKAQEIGRNFMWTLTHRMRGPGSTAIRPASSPAQRRRWRSAGPVPPRENR